jgi:NADPH-dependent 2,4-dienoyl-CoA reductase/sulfur reductase-like enzyme
MQTARDASLAFLEAARAAPKNLAQSRLLNTADRDLGALLFPLTEEERAYIYALVGPAKTEKLYGEVQRMRHVRLSGDTVGRIAAHIISHLSGDRPLGPASRYFRPHR